MFMFEYPALCYILESLIKFGYFKEKGRKERLE